MQSAKEPIIHAISSLAAMTSIFNRTTLTAVRCCFAYIVLFPQMSRNGNLLCHSLNYRKFPHLETTVHVVYIYRSCYYVITNLYKRLSSVTFIVICK